MEIPVKPVVPPAPSALNPADYPQKHDAWAASIAPVVDYVDQSVNEMHTGLSEAAAMLAASSVSPGDLAGKGGQLVTVNSAGTALNFTSPDTNLVINGHFEFWQRNTSQTTSGYNSADRWGQDLTGGTVAMSRQDFALDSVFAGNNLRHFLRQTVSGQTLASHYAAVSQRIEDVRTLAGQTVTVLFWAKASAARPIAVELHQNFGTGGSPSAQTLIAPVTVNLTTDWQAYAATFNMPSVSGKVLGTAGNDYLGLTFWTSAGANFNARANGLGLRSGDVDITGIHIRRGAVTAAAVDSYRVPDRVAESARCYRYFHRVVSDIGCGGVAIPGQSISNPVFYNFPARMRVAPTIMTAWAAYIDQGNMPIATFADLSEFGVSFRFATFAGVTGVSKAGGFWTAGITFDAEI